MTAIKRLAAFAATAAGAGLIAQAALAGPGCNRYGVIQSGSTNGYQAVRGQRSLPEWSHDAARSLPFRAATAYRTAWAPYPGLMVPPCQRPLPAPLETSRVTTSLPVGSGESDPAGDHVTAHINGMRCEPSTVTLKPGTTVTWVQGSSMPHTVTGNVDGLRSSTLYSGQQYSHTFDATGRYDHACDFHPSMKGSVIVEATGRDT